MMLDFSNEEKIKLFDDIAEKYFDRNFGQMQKSDMETLLFSHYIEHCLNNSLPFDDYTLSAQLGISQARVRALKERKQLRYPYDNYNWKEAFVKLIPNARYNDEKKLVQMNIHDVNLLNDVRHHMENKGWFDEYQLNPRLFQCRLDFFIKLCGSFDEAPVFSDDIQQKMLEQMPDEKTKNALTEFFEGTFEAGMSELVKNLSKEVITALLKTIPFGGLAAEAISCLIKVINK